MADAKTAEAEKPEVPKLMRSFSKGYQKTKEAFKKGFSTTPRGSRSLSGRMASTEIPDLEPTAPAEAPQVGHHTCTFQSSAGPVTVHALTLAPTCCRCPASLQRRASRQA